MDRCVIKRRLYQDILQYQLMHKNKFRMFDPVDVVCFDLDDTLWPCRPVLERAEQTVFEWLSTHCPAVTEKYSSSGLVKRRMAYMSQQMHLQHDMTSMRYNFFIELFKDFGIRDPDFARQALNIFRSARNEVQPFDDVVPALRKLQNKYVLTSYSNGNAQLESTGLMPYFDGAHLSEHTGFAKPKREAFNWLVSHYETVPQRILFVGDDAGNDIDGPRDAGMQVCWINRTSSSWESSSAAPVSVRNLLELAAFLV